ncbi:hypothetical protein BHE74_00025168 [Ensete ventricosum]|nr:hypothetical protein BHE74_00025168 [Ensete ventricosum]
MPVDDTSTGVAPMGTAPTGDHSCERLAFQEVALVSNNPDKRLPLWALPLPALNLLRATTSMCDRPLRASCGLLPRPVATWMPLVGGPSNSQPPLQEYNMQVAAPHPPTALPLLPITATNA